MTYIKVSFKVVVSLFFVYIIYRVIDVDNLPINRISLSLSIVLQFVGALLLSIILRAYRWKILASRDSEETINIFISLKYLLIGSTLNIFLPSGAGDVLKGYFAGKEKGDSSRMYSASIYDKLIAVSSLFFISLYGFYYSGNYWVLLAGILAFTPLLIMLSTKRLMNAKFTRRMLRKTSNHTIGRLAQFLQGDFHIGIWKFALTTLISIVAWLSTYYILFLCFQSVDLFISLENVFTNSPMITLGRLFPFTLSGIGSDEALIIYLFKSVSSSVEVILVGALLYRIVAIFIPGILGIPFLLLFRNKK